MKNILSVSSISIRLLCLITLVTGSTRIIHAHTNISRTIPVQQSTQLHTRSNTQSISKTDTQAVHNSHSKLTILERIQKKRAALMQYLRSHRLVAGAATLITGAGITAYYLFKNSDMSPVSAIHAATSGSATQKKHNQTKQETVSNKSHNLSQNSINAALSDGADTDTSHLNSCQTTQQNSTDTKSSLSMLYPKKDNNTKQNNEERYIAQSLQRETLYKDLYHDRTISIEQVQTALNAGADIYQLIDPAHKVSVAMLAAAKNDSELIQLLLEHEKKQNNGAPSRLLSDVDAQQCTLLMWAAAHDALEVTKLLAPQSFNLEAKDHNGFTALMKAAYEGHEIATEQLINAKANIDAQNVYGNTALMWAITNDHTAVTQRLIAAKADATLHNKSGKNALQLAKEYNNKTIKKALKAQAALKKHNTHTADVILNTDTDRGATRTDTHNEQRPLTQNSLANNGDRESQTPETCGGDDNEQRRPEQATLENNKNQSQSKEPVSPHKTINSTMSLSDKDATKPQQKTSTLVANTNCVNSTTNVTCAMIYAAQNNKEEIQRLLKIEQIQDALTPYQSSHPLTTDVDSDGSTVLMYAANQGHDKMVQLLIKAKAPLDTQNNAGETALTLAAEKGHSSVVESLLTAGADREKQNTEGETALWIAAYNGHAVITQKLLDAKANGETPDHDGDTPLWGAIYEKHSQVTQLLIAAKADLEKQNNNHLTPLLWTAAEGLSAINKQLLNAKANLETQDPDGGTALFNAAYEGHDEIVQQLIEAKADLEAVDKHQRTPLIWAAKQGHRDVVTTLLNKKANPEAADIEGKTAAIWATQEGHQEVAQLLTDARDQNKSQNTLET